MSQLSSDCLHEIFEYLEDNEVTLLSCLLVNHLWCGISVRILWRSIRNYNTLITCLPIQSKEILNNNGIITSTSTSNVPLFNYASFCKIISIYQVNFKIKRLIKYQQSISSQSLNSQSLSNNIYDIVTQEIFKLLMSQTFSLRKLNVDCYLLPRQSLNFTSYPGAGSCLKDLSELICHSDIYPEFFRQLSHMCHNIEILDISFEIGIPSGLTDVISSQQNLKCLYISHFCEISPDIYASLTKLPNTLIKLYLYGGQHYMPLSFIAKFANLQELVLYYYDGQNTFEDFKSLQYVTFSHLEILKFQCECPRYELLIKFLENNGKNLKEFYVSDSDNSLNLAIVKFCPNLRNLFSEFRSNELETLKMIFNSCKYLERIKTWCCNNNLNEKDLLEVVVKYSPKNFYELKLNYSWNAVSKLLPEELEFFFIDWIKHTQKFLNLIIIHNDARSLELTDENMKIIEKYIKLGIIKKFKTINYDFDDEDE